MGKKSIALVGDHEDFNDLICHALVRGYRVLYSPFPDDSFVEEIGSKYEGGGLTATELKEITSDFVISLIEDHNKKRSKHEGSEHKVLNTPIESIF